jgi:hypothetical protein
MIIDWTGQHIYIGGWSAWSYNPYGVEEGVYVPATLNYYGDVFDGHRPNIFTNVYTGNKYHGEHRPDVVGYTSINIDPPAYFDQPQLFVSGPEDKYVGVQKPSIKKDILRADLIAGHRPIIKK